jgi:hypothetical protein
MPGIAATLSVAIASRHTSLAAFMRSPLWRTRSLSAG